MPMTRNEDGSKTVNTSLCKSQTLQVSCVQLHWARPLEYNLERTLEYIDRAADSGSRVVVFPEANLTSYYFPYITDLPAAEVHRALSAVCEAAAFYNVWVIAGTIRKTRSKYLNLAHVISPEGKITHEYAKTHLAGVDEKKYCRAGNKFSLFQIDGIWCTLRYAVTADTLKCTGSRRWRGRKYCFSRLAVLTIRNPLHGNVPLAERSSLSAPVHASSIALLTRSVRLRMENKPQAALLLSGNRADFPLRKQAIIRRR